MHIGYSDTADRGVTVTDCNQECRFMEKRVREISRFFVALRREFAPAVCARRRTPFSLFTTDLESTLVSKRIL